MCDLLQAAHDVVEISELKVGASYAHLEQSISRKGQSFLLAVQEHRARRMPRCAYYNKGVVAESNFSTVIKMLAYTWEVVAAIYTDERLGLCSKLVHERLVAFVHFRT